MPSVNLTIKWPNGDLSNFYSPSTIIYDFFKSGEHYKAADFLSKADQALHAASERVRMRYGFSCTSAMDTLSKIQYQVKYLALKQDDMVEVVELYNID